MSYHEDLLSVLRSLNENEHETKAFSCMALVTSLQSAEVFIQFQPTHLDLVHIHVFQPDG